MGRRLLGAQPALLSGRRNRQTRHDQRTCSRRDRSSHSRRHGLGEQPKGETRTTTADSLGAYEVSGLSPGRYSVRAVVQGYVPYEEVWVEIEASAGQTIDLPCASLSRSKS